MKLKKDYIAPGLTVVSFKMEKGYATSVTIASLGDMELGFVNEMVSHTDLMMGDQMGDLTNGGGSNSYFGFGAEGTGVLDNDGSGHNWF